MSVTPISPAPSEAQPSSLLAEARALEPVLENLLARIRSVLAERPPVVLEAAEPQAQCHWTDRTDAQMRAYLDNVCPLRGVDYANDAGFHRGRSLIERLALSAKGTDLPPSKLTASQVADVLRFMSSIEPVDPATWFADSDEDAPSHLVGQQLLLESLEESLRAIA